MGEVSSSGFSAADAQGDFSRARRSRLLGFVEQLSQRSGVRIDEEDYPELRTLRTVTAFLAGRAP